MLTRFHSESSIFEDILSNAVSKCDVFLAIISDAWLGSNDRLPDGLIDSTDFVRIETESCPTTASSYRTEVLVAETRMPTEDKLPDVLRPIAFRNAAELGLAVI